MNYMHALYIQQHSGKFQYGAISVTHNPYLLQLESCMKVFNYASTLTETSSDASAEASSAVSFFGVS
jgi:hypothetical protein